MKNAHQPFARLDERSVDSVDLVVEAARVAQVVARGVASPQWRVVRAAVHTLAALFAHLQHAICFAHTCQLGTQQLPTHLPNNECTNT